MRQLDVLVADHHPIYVQGLESVLSEPCRQFHFNIKGVVKSGKEITDLLNRNNPDLLLLDLALPEMDGLKMVPAFKKNHSKTRILVMAGAQDPLLARALYDAGADGFMLKSGSKDELLQVIEQIVDGGSFWSSHEANGQLSADPLSEFAEKHHLTQREMEIFRLIGNAMDNHQIGKHLFISHQTVSVHRKNIMRKLGVNSTASLIKIAFENHLV